MTFCIPNLSTFFWVVATFFDEVARYEFGRLRQNGPETSQPASPVVEFTLTNHVHLSLTCGEAGWGRAYGFALIWMQAMRVSSPHPFLLLLLLLFYYLFLFFYFSGARQWDSLYDITHGLVSFSRFTSSLSTAVPLQRLFSQSLWPVACEFLSVFVVISTSTLAQWTSAQQKSRTVATFIVHACGRPSARQHRSYGFQIHVQGFTFFMLSTTLMKHSVFILFYFIFI